MTISSDAVSRTVHVSDEAYDTLMAHARAAGYINGDIRARGMSRYVAYLMTCDMQDVRPLDVRVQDAKLIRAGYTPEWRMYSPRRPRILQIAPVTLTEASVHCVRLGIAYADRTLIGAPAYWNGLQCLSALLEAIGTEWVEVITDAD